MGRSVDGISLPLVFAVVLLCLAKVLAAEKTGAAVQQKLEDEQPSRYGIFLTPPPKFAETKAVKPNGSGQFCENAPNFKLKDPHGNAIAASELYGKTGMLIMLTVPNLTQYEKQKRWDKWLKRQPWPEAFAPQRVLLEDLSQQTTFKNKARALMAASYKPDAAMKVLIDEDGEVRRQFGVRQNETVILLVDHNGSVIHHEEDEVEPDQTAAQRLIAHVYELTKACAAKAAPQPKIIATVLAAP